MKKINIISLGCSKNTVDSEVLTAKLYDRGFNVVNDSAGKCDVVIINTCGFINDAKEESLDVIFEWIEQKKRGNVEKIFVFGCLSQRYREDLQKEIPEVDSYFGVMDFDRVVNELDSPLSKKNPPTVRRLITPSHYAYLKISEGCDRNCSFCAIPMIRGKNASTPIQKLFDESRWLGEKGVKELIIIAQDITRYGVDIYGEQSLAKLLDYLSVLDKIKWIRLLYAHPQGFPRDILNIMAANSAICKYIDIPIQHISNSLLKSMQRSHTSTQVKELIELFRTAVPGIAIRTSMIVGYPGETDKDFDELCNFVTNTKFERMGVFKYSPEEGTAAAALNDDVPDEVKQERFDTLMQIQQEISLEKNMEKIGKKLTVIVDSKDDNLYIARSEYDAPEVDNEVLIETDKELKIGEFYEVIINKADYYDLYASY